MTLILVVAVVLLFVGLDLLRRRGPVRGRDREPSTVQPIRGPGLPADLFVAPEHLWVRLMADGTLRVGLDDLVAELLGRVDHAECTTSTLVQRGEPLVHLRQGERQLTLVAPAAGEVVQVNPLLQENPQVVVDDPYGVGWIASLRPRDHKQAIAPLHLGNGAVGFLRRELEQVLDFLSPSPLLADGGLPRRGALADLDPTAWSAFEERFLR